MDKYEYSIRSEQILKLVAEKEYKTAAKIADTIDWRRVRNVNMLMTVGEVYEKSGRYEDARDILLMAYAKAPIGRRLAYKLTEVCIHIGDFEEAQVYYKDFVNLSPNDSRRYELLYYLNKKQGASNELLITILEEYKKNDMDERWAFELAVNYYYAGMKENCVAQCDEIFLWFRDGDYVLKALELKSMLAPLTEEQQYVVNEAATAAAKEEARARERAKAAAEIKKRNLAREKESKISDGNKAETESEITLEAVSEEEIGNEEDYNAHLKGDTIDIRKEQRLVRNASINNSKEIQNTQEIDEEDDQIEGQMTIEELLINYETREHGEAYVAAEETLTEMPEASADISDTEEKSETEILPDIESAEADTDELFMDKAEEEEQPAEDYVGTISEAVDKAADDMIDEAGEAFFEIGLTNKQRSIFRNFLFMRDMEEQLTEFFRRVSDTKVGKSSSEGNLIVVGDHKSGKTTLAVNIIKEINRIHKRRSRKIAKISGERLNYKGIRETFSQFSSADLLVENAGRISKSTLLGLLRFMDGETGGMLVVFEDTKDGMEYIFSQVPEAKKYFNYRIELNEVEIAEWVDLAARYAKEKNFIIDDIAKLALSAKIANLYNGISLIEFTDVQCIVDDAIIRYNRKHIFKKRKKSDTDSYFILKESDFK